MAWRRLAIALVFALMILPGLARAQAMSPAGAVSQGTSPGDWADQTTAAHNDWDVKDKPSGAMYQLLSQVLLNFGDYTPKNACEGAAANVAWQALADTANSAPLNGFLDAIKNAFKGIWKVASFGADPSSASDLVDAPTLIDKAIDQAKDQGQDALKEKLKEIWQGKKKEVFKTSGSKGACSYVLIAVWDKAASSYEIVIYGDCGCNLVPGWKGGSVTLATWAVTLKGTIIPDKTDEDGLVYKVGPPKITVSANCICPKKGSQTVRPPGGSSGVTPPTGGGSTTPPPPPKDPAKVTTTCPPCQVYVDQLKAAMAQDQQAERDRRDIADRIAAAKSRGDTAEAAQLEAQNSALANQDAAIQRLIQDLWAKLKDCEEKKCPKVGMYCPNPPSDAPIDVGPNGKVGSGARAKQKAASTALGLVGGLLGGGGGGGSSSGPELASCRVRDKDMTLVSDPETGVMLKLAARRSSDTVTVFAEIAKSPDSGTFQAAYLEAEDGGRLAPKDVRICELWGEWSLSVSWTRTTYVNDQVVSRQSGGWSRQGQFNVPGLVSSEGAPDGLWKRMGFSNASHGARETALSFYAPAQALAAQPVDLVIHVTRPGQNPVSTVPFLLRVTEGPGGFAFARETRTACGQRCAGG
jgi:hypothetical protein